MCWNHRAIRDTWVLERERRLPYPRHDDNVRVSDADRDDVIMQLSRHTGDGRLSLEEFETRADEVYASKTRSELQRALRELPVPHTERRSSRRAPQLRIPIVVAVIALVTLAPAALWWIIPVAFFTVCRPPHHHHPHHRQFDDRRDDSKRDELISA